MEIFCPAKVNLMLAVTGRRPDGYHELVSLMAPLDLGDRLFLEEAAEGGSSFTCSDQTLAMDDKNLVVRAARIFEERFPKTRGYHLHLEKRIPAGAGLGGGSSDAAGTLMLLNRWSGEPCSAEGLAGMATVLGADCPFFLHGGPMIARGIGERLENLPEAVRSRLAGTKLLLLKPSFGVPTAWAYRRMAERKTDYCPAEDAEKRLRSWVESSAPASSLFFNNMEAAVFEKHVALPVLKERLSALGLDVMMSGSGSTLVVAGGDGEQAWTKAEKLAREAWGESAWVARACIL